MKFTMTFALASLLAGTSFAQAQHAHGAHHHGGHGHGAHVHGGYGAKAHGAAKRRGQGRRGSVRAEHGAHGGASAGAQAPSTRELMAAHAKMMRDMNQPYTGDPDADFRIQMIPHHQGAIDMARVALRRANDPFTRQLAESVIVEQQREIREMQVWLAQRGYRAPDGATPTHIMGWNSYRSLPSNPGTLEEKSGKSWAPGSGAPRR